MSACISRHGEYSEHTPDAEWVCTQCGDVDTAGLRDEVDRLRAGIEALARDGEAYGRGSALALSRRLRTLLDPTEGVSDE